jgi:zona occludens toxin
MIGVRGSLRRQAGFIHLRTGANGTGKTLFTLKDVRELQLRESRPVYYDNIELKGDALTWGWIRRNPREWESFPPGSIIVCDEAHKYFPKRSGSQKEPGYVEAIAEHRAQGKDFFFITQHPADLDIFIRRRVASPGWHQHLKRKGGSELTSFLEWNTCKDEPEKQGTAASALVSTRAFPREMYEVYSSAVMHTAKFRMPRQIWYMVYGLLAVFALLYYGLHGFMGGTKPKDKAPAESALMVKTAAPARSEGSKQASTAAEYVASYQPRIEGLAHTAPAYDGLTQPTRVPVPAACMEWAKKGCHCFTQDGTPYPTTVEICRQVVKAGVFLNFEVSPGAGARHQEQAAKAPRSAQAGPEVSGAQMTSMGAGRLAAVPSSTR